MGLNSQPISDRRVVRQDAEPSRKLDGMIWINPTGGNNGNNLEWYSYAKSSGSWELWLSHGPDDPLYDKEGALWSDTANDNTKVFDGAAWSNIGVSDHSNLSNVTSGQHHSPPSFAMENGFYTGADTGVTTVNLSNTYSSALVHAGIEGNDTDNYYGDVMVRSWGTDANGNITSVDLRVCQYTTRDVYWDVMGVLA